jgi:hypothetical protein
MTPSTSHRKPTNYQRGEKSMFCMQKRWFFRCPFKWLLLLLLPLPLPPPRL